jgi:hypothetical protein
VVRIAYSAEARRFERRLANAAAQGHDLQPFRPLSVRQKLAQAHPPIAHAQGEGLFERGSLVDPRSNS